MPPAPTHIIRRWAHSFSPRAVPLLSRASYTHELKSVTLLPIALTCTESGVIGVVAKKTFDAPDLAIASIAAAPAVGNIASALWTRLSHGHDRVRFANLLQAAVLICVALMALVPVSITGAWTLVALTIVARMLHAGVLTARSDIWRANYPSVNRARITGRLSIISSLIVAATSFIAGYALDTFTDQRPDTFRFVFATAVAAASFGIYAYSKIHWRGRAAHLAHERARRATGKRAPGLAEMLAVLKQDRDYRRYMIAQFVLGTPNIAAMAPFIIGLEEQFGLGYDESMALTLAIPIAVPVLVIPLWASYLDRVHVATFRARHSWFFVAANALLGVGFLTDSIAAIYASRVCLGAAFGGGILAWQLGHHDFAKRHNATVYMGIHVTLTGVRGLIAPFIGTALYSGIVIASATDTPRTLLHGIGGWTFIIFAGLGVIAAFMFIKLSADVQRAGHVRRDG